ncbi:MAG: hypothetical protein AAGD22_09250 [Verrucomicrobiota bacterium]
MRSLGEVSTGEFFLLGLIIWACVLVFDQGPTFFLVGRVYSLVVDGHGNGTRPWSLVGVSGVSVDSISWRQIRVGVVLGVAVLFVLLAIWDGTGDLNGGYLAARGAIHLLATCYRNCASMETSTMSAVG